MKTRICLSLLLPLAAFALATAARANLVANGSFEGAATPDSDTFGYLPADWTYASAADGFGFLTVGGNTSDPNGEDFFVPAEDGNEFAAFGAFGSDPDTLSQTLATTAGENYTFSFYVDTDLANGSPFYLNASWDGTQLAEVSSPSLLGGWSEYTFTETAAGSDTISFSGYDPAGYTLLDNVSVAAVPSAPDRGPGALLAAVTLLGLCLAAMSLRGSGERLRLARC